MDSLQNLSPKRGTAIKAVVLITSFISMLNETGINVALPSLMKTFGVSVGQIQWLVTGFMLIMAAIVPVTAFILQSFRTKAVYFSTLLFFLAGGLIAGFAPSFPVLLAGRLVQAIGTACLMALTVNVVLMLTPDEKKGGAMGLVGLVTLFAPAIAPSLSGLTLQLGGWQALIFLPLPLFVILGVLAGFILENVIPHNPSKLDLLSVVLEALGFAGLLFGISGLGDLSGSSGFLHIGSLAAGLVLVALFCLRQLRMQRPLLNIRVFRQSNFALAMIAVFFGIFSAFGMMMILPMLYQQGLGLSAAIAGLALLPGGVLNGLTAPLFGKIFDRHGPRALVIGGGLFIVLGFLALSLAPALLGVFIAAHIVAMLALSAAMTSSQANAMFVPPAETPHATAILSTLMQLGGGIGSAFFSACFAAGAARHGGTSADAILAGARTAFLGGAIFALIPFAASFFVRKPRLGQQ